MKSPDTEWKFFKEPGHLNLAACPHLCWSQLLGKDRRRKKESISFALGWRIKEEEVGLDTGLKEKGQEGDGSWGFNRLWDAKGAGLVCVVEWRGVGGGHLPGQQ